MSYESDYRIFESENHPPEVSQRVLGAVLIARLLDIYCTARKRGDQAIADDCLVFLTNFGDLDEHQALALNERINSSVHNEFAGVN